MSVFSCGNPPGPCCKPSQQLSSPDRPDEPPDEPCWEPRIDFDYSQPPPGIKPPQLGVEQKVQKLEALAEQLLQGLANLRGSIYESPRPVGVSDVFISNGSAAQARRANELSAVTEQRRTSDSSLALPPKAGVYGQRLEMSNGLAGAGPPDASGIVASRGSAPALDSTKIVPSGADSTEHLIGHLMVSGTQTKECLRSLNWRDVMNMAGGIIIVGHIICIGFATQNSLDEVESLPLNVLEHLFLGYYLCEMCVFLFMDGVRKSFTDSWFCFDVLLVGIGILSQWLYPLIVMATAGSGGVDGLEKALTIRILRLGRLLRALRVVESFKDLWKLVTGILRSTRTVLSACLLIFITLYVFALVGVEVVTKDETLLENDETAVLVRGNFDSVFGVLLTLVQFANADSIAGLYDPLIRAQPILMLYFGAVWVVVTILLMNLVTAVVIENAIALATEDAEVAAREKKKKLAKMVPVLKEAFDAVDQSDDGMLQIDEVEGLCHLPLPRELKEIMQKERMMDLFRCLDRDETGDVSKEEFVRGICQVALSDVPIETTQMLSMLRIQSKTLDDLHLKLTGTPPYRSMALLEHQRSA